MDAFEADLEANDRDGRARCFDLDRWAEKFARVHGQLHSLQQRVEALEKENAELKLANAELKKQLSGSATPAKVDEPFSVRAEEQRQEARGKKSKRKESKKQRRGRRANEAKIKRAEKTEDVHPLNVPPDRCRLSHVRVVWRLIDGRAMLIAYRIFRGPKKQYGVIPGVLGRSEFGLEIVVTLAYLVQIVGLSFDKACLVMGFLQQVKLSKSQADALLRQLSYHWREEFEILCTLLANSLVVHADETSWSINSVWTFLSEKARLLFFGVHKDEATLKEILDPATFAGLLCSDDAAVYGNFTNAQKCWAHLLRKAIKLTLQAPHKEQYRDFADGLLAIYRTANRILRDQRLGDAGRARKVDELVDVVFDLCGPVLLETWEREGLQHDRRLLAAEIMRLALKHELFTFVTSKPAEQPNGARQPLSGTNNEAERTLRGPAQARKTKRTSKTIVGARRTTIVTSVLESLRLYLPTYTLSTVIEEIKRWQQTGRSCFRALLEKLNIELPDHSVLDRVLPVLPEPSG
jgi:transposase